MIHSLELDFSSAPELSWAIRGLKIKLIHKETLSLLGVSGSPDTFHEKGLAPPRMLFECEKK